MTNELRVMTSGAFTAAHLALLPQVEALTGQKVLTLTTSIGTGETSIPNRLKRGEVADVVIVADALLRQFIADGVVLPDPSLSLAERLKALFFELCFLLFSLHTHLLNLHFTLYFRHFWIGLLLRIGGIFFK